MPTTATSPLTIFDPTQVSAGGIKNLSTDIDNKARIIQDSVTSDAMQKTSRGLQSLQNQINHLWQAIRNYSAGQIAAGVTPASNVQDVNLASGANTVNFAPPVNVGDLLVETLIGPNAASTLTWGANFEAITPTQFNPNGTTRFTFIGRITPSTSTLQWSCTGVLGL